eukprot:UN27781
MVPDNNHEIRLYLSAILYLFLTPPYSNSFTKCELGRMKITYRGCVL